MAALEERVHEVAEEVLGGFVEEGFVGAGAEEDFVAMSEGAGYEAVLDAGILKAVEGKGDFGGAAGADFGSGEEAGGSMDLRWAMAVADRSSAASGSKAWGSWIARLPSSPRSHCVRSAVEE